MEEGVGTVTEVWVAGKIRNRFGERIARSRRVEGNQRLVGEASLGPARNLGWSRLPGVYENDSRSDSWQWGIWIMAWPPPVFWQDPPLRDKDTKPTTQLLTQNVSCLEKGQERSWNRD